MDFGKFIRQERQKAGLTLRQVAIMTGDTLDKTNLSRIERNERILSLKAAFFLSEIYGIDIKKLTKLYMGDEAKVRKLTAAERKPRKRGRPPKKK